MQGLKAVAKKSEMPVKDRKFYLTQDGCKFKKKRPGMK